MKKSKKIYRGEYLYNYMTLDRFYNLLYTKIWEFSDYKTANDYRERCSYLLKDMDGDACERLKCIRYSCFSQKKDISPMWYFYAGNYSGVCLEINVKKMKEKFGKYVEFYYINYLPMNNFSDIEQNSHYDLVEYLLIKNGNWEYKKEVRMFYTPKDNEGSFFDILPCISKIYIGRDCPLNMLCNMGSVEFLKNVGIFRILSTPDGRNVALNNSKEVIEQFRTNLSKLD